MFNDTLSGYASTPRPVQSDSHFPTFFWGKLRLNQTWLILAAAIFLVSVPVFFQAPLVRLFPMVSLAMTGGWIGLSLWLMSRPKTQVWGDLLIGFTWSWLAGSIYWGWLRWEPSVHLPVEAIGLPFALWCVTRNRWLVGNWFYLGSLFGTAMTDVYFYVVDLIPHWRQIMQVEPELALPIFQSAIAQVQTPWGISTGVALLTVLTLAGLVPLCYRQGGVCPPLHRWAFAGAVLSTILVDGLFLIAASVA